MMRNNKSSNFWWRNVDYGQKKLMDKKERLSKLARKIADIIEKDIQAYGEMKTSYLSPKFWVYVEEAMKNRTVSKKDNSDKISK